MKRDQHLKPPSPSLPLLFIGRSRFLFPRFSATALLFDPRWMGVFNTLDKVVRVKYGFVETIVSKQSYRWGSEPETRTLFLLNLAHSRETTFSCFKARLN